MHRFLALVPALATLLAPAVAAAQTVVYVPWTPPTYVLAAPAEVAPAPMAMQQGSRFRFGIGGQFVVGVGGEQGANGTVGTFAPGLQLDLGVQLNRQLAVYAHGSMSSLLISNHAALHGVIEYTPTDLISLGTGLGWSGMLSGFSGYETAACVRAPCDFVRTRDRWGGVSIPAILGFNLGSRNAQDGRLKSFRINLEAAVGIEPSTGASGWTTTLAFGYVSM